MFAISEHLCYTGGKKLIFLSLEVIYETADTEAAGDLRFSDPVHR
jgi:hypothetical protein